MKFLQVLHFALFVFTFSTSSLQAGIKVISTLIDEAAFNTVDNIVLGYDFYTPVTLQINELGYYNDLFNPGILAAADVAIFSIDEPSIPVAMASFSPDSLGVLAGDYRYLPVEPVLLGKGLYRIVANTGSVTAGVSNFFPIQLVAPALDSSLTYLGSYVDAPVIAPIVSFPLLGTDGNHFALASADFTIIPEPAYAAMLSSAIAFVLVYLRRRC